MKVMSDIFLQEDIQNLLHNKFVVFIGDSIQRAIYKDFVLLLQKNNYLKDFQLRAKGEFSFEKDELIEGGRKGVMCNGVNYREVRQYRSDWHLVRFYFTTRCYNNYMESILADLENEPRPDLIVMNSCLWDISRYGNNGVEDYKKNLVKLFERFQKKLPEDCLVIWSTTLPISKNARGGFLVPEIEFMNSSLRLDILEANFYARQVVVSHGFDIIDLHYYLRNQLHRRAEDGIHWDMTAHRRITNLLLTHVAEAWQQKLPGRSKLRLPQCQETKNTIAEEILKENQIPDNESVLNPVCPVSKKTEIRKGKKRKNKKRIFHNTFDPNNNDVPEWADYNTLVREPDRNEEIMERYGGPVRRTEYYPAHHSEVESYNQYQEEGRFHQNMLPQQHQWNIPMQMPYDYDNQCQPWRNDTGVHTLGQPSREHWNCNNNPPQLTSRQESLYQRMVENSRAFARKSQQRQFQENQENYYEEEPEEHVPPYSYESYNRPVVPNAGPLTFNFDPAMTLNFNTGDRETTNFNWMPYEQRNTEHIVRNASRFLPNHHASFYQAKPDPNYYKDFFY